MSFKSVVQLGAAVPALPRYELGQELVLDAKTGLLRPKRSGKRRIYTSKRFWVADVFHDSVTVEMKDLPHGGVAR